MRVSLYSLPFLTSTRPSATPKLPSPKASTMKGAGISMTSFPVAGSRKRILPPSSRTGTRFFRVRLKTSSGISILDLMTIFSLTSSAMSTYSRSIPGRISSYLTVDCRLGRIFLSLGRVPSGTTTTALVLSPPARFQLISYWSFLMETSFEALLFLATLTL